MTTKPRMTAEEAREAIKAYNPETDFRYWQQMAKVWKQAAHDMAEIARELTRDGKASEVARRLTAELSDRNNQEDGEKRSAIDKFAKTADDLVIDSIYAARQDAVHNYNAEVARAAAEARREAEARTKAQREERYKADLAEAEARRNGTAPAKACHL